MPGESQRREGLGVIGSSSVTEGGFGALTGVQMRTLSTNETLLKLRDFSESQPCSWPWEA